MTTTYTTYVAQVQWTGDPVWQDLDRRFDNAKAAQKYLKARHVHYQKAIEDGFLRVRKGVSGGRVVLRNVVDTEVS